MKLKNLFLLVVALSNGTLFCSATQNHKTGREMNGSGGASNGASAMVAPSKDIFNAVRNGDHAAYTKKIAENDTAQKQGKPTVNLNSPEDLKSNQTLLILAVKGLKNANAQKRTQIEAIVTDLIKRKANAGAQETETGNTALHIALQNNAKAIALKLIKAMNDLEVTNKDGNTPLHIIALQADASNMADNLELAQQLIERFVTRSPKNNAGKTPLALAQKKVKEQSKGSASAAALIGLGYGAPDDQVNDEQPNDSMVKYLMQVEAEAADHN